MQRESNNNDGYIEILSLVKFNSIRKYSKVIEDIAAAARLVPSVVVSKDGAAIRRKDPLPETGSSDSVARSVFVDNVPMQTVTPSAANDVKDENSVEGEANATTAEEPSSSSSSGAAAAPAASTKGSLRFTVSVDGVKALFEQFGKIALIRFRFSKSDLKKKVDKQALGSLFIEFESAESAVSCAAAAAGSLKFGDNELTIKSMSAFLAKDGKGGKKGASASAGGGADSAASAAAAESAKEVKPLEWTKGCVITFASLPPACDREALKSAVESAAVGAPSDEDNADPLKDLYVDYSRGEKTGAVRFGKTSKTVLHIAEKAKAGEVSVGDAKIEGKLLEGEEEEQYWRDAAVAYASRQKGDRNNNKRGRDGGHGGGRGGGYKKGKRN